MPEKKAWLWVVTVLAGLFDAMVGLRLGVFLFARWQRRFPVE